MTSEVDDVQLVCYGPFELVPLLPAGQPPALTFAPGRADLLARYELVHRYDDVLAPFEEVSVTAVGRSGGRVGPLLLGPQTTNGLNLAPDAFPSRAAFQGHLGSRRLLGFSSRSVAFALPRGLARNDLVRLDVTRRFTSVDVRLAPSAPDLSGLPG